MKISYPVTPLCYLITLFIISSTDKVYHCTFYLILLSATTSTKHIILGPIMYKYHLRRFLGDVHHQMVWQRTFKTSLRKKKRTKLVKKTTAWVCCPIGPLHSLQEGWTPLDCWDRRRLHNVPRDKVFHYTVRNSQQNMVTVLKMLFIWGSIQWQQRTQQNLHSPELQL